MKYYPKMIALLIGGLWIAGNLPAQHAELTEYTGYGSCKGCHDQAWAGGGQHADEVMASIHWTWEKTDSYTGDKVGKYNVINNYCVAVKSNEPRCTSCHIGIGWSDTTWVPADNRDSIDCLVCHDKTGTYKKIPTGSGAPVPDLDYAAITASIGTPDRDNCGACHFFGGGGDAVKHGTLDSTMATRVDQPYLTALFSRSTAVCVNSSRSSAPSSAALRSAEATFCSRLMVLPE